MMSIEHLEQKLVLAHAKLTHCEQLAAWPILSPKSALKTDDWVRSLRLAALHCLKALAQERRRLGVKSLHTLPELRLSVALLRQLDGEKAQHAAELLEMVIRMRERRRQRLADERIPATCPHDHRRGDQSRVSPFLVIETTPCGHVTDASQYQAPSVPIRQTTRSDEPPA
jgi:hypothetical protein